MWKAAELIEGNTCDFPILHQSSFDCTIKTLRNLSNKCTDGDPLVPKHFSFIWKSIFGWQSCILFFNLDFLPTDNKLPALLDLLKGHIVVTIQLSHLTMNITGGISLACKKRGQQWDRAMISNHCWVSEARPVESRMGEQLLATVFPDFASHLPVWLEFFVKFI